jgi:WD40 repeat protein
MSKFDNLLPEDAEYLVNLPSHLAEACMAEDLCDILIDFDFAQHKIGTLGVRPLVEDFDLTKNSTYEKELKLIQRALEISANILEKDQTQLASQLLGRLLKFTDSSKIKKLLGEAKQYQDTPWLRPLTSSLKSPKSSLIYNLVSQSSRSGLLSGIAVTPDSKSLVSSFLDGRIVIWDLATGKEAKTYLIDQSSDLSENEILGIAITHDGRKIVSVLRYNKITILDLETGNQIFSNIACNRGNSQSNTKKTNLGKSWFSSIFERMSDIVEKVKIQYSFVESICSFQNFIQLEKPIIITPNNKKVITAPALGNTVKVWDLDTGKELFNCIAGKLVNSLAVTPDSKWFVSGGVDDNGFGLIIIWDINTGERVRTITAHDKAIKAVAITPDGQKLISASKDQTLIIWDLITGNQLKTLIGHTSHVLTLAITPDSKYVASGSADESIRIWNLDTGNLEKVLIGHHDTRINKIRLTNDGKYLISSADDNKLILWNLITGEECAFGQDFSNVSSLFTITPDDKKIISTCNDTIKVWDLSINQRVEVIDKVNFTFTKKINLNSHTKTVNQVVSIPSSQLIITGSSDATVKIWNFITGEEIKTLTGHHSAITVIKVTPDNQQIISISVDGIVKSWDLNTYTEIRSFQINLLDICVVSPDGKQIVSAAGNGIIKIWDLLTSQEIKSFTIQRNNILKKEYINAWAITSNGKQIIVSLRSIQWDIKSTLAIWDLATGQEIILQRHNEYVSVITITSDNQYLISGSSDETIKIWNLATREEIRTLPAPARISALAVNSNSQQVIASSCDGSTIVWDISTGKQIQTLTDISWTGFGKHITSLTVTLDNQYIISGSQDGTVIAWDFASGNQLFIATRTKNDYSTSKDFSKIFTGMIDAFPDVKPVYTIIITPNGKQAVSGLYDKKVKIWDLETGEEIFTFYGHDWMIEALDITPDGQRVISVSDPDTIKVWNLFTKKEELTIQDSDRSLFLWADYMVYELLRNRPIVLSHPDNKKIIIATKSGNNSIEIYNITTGKKELTLKGHTDCITAIALAFNSEKL